MHHYVKSRIRRQYLMRQTCDYLQYTFTPPFGFVMALIAYGAVAIMAIILGRLEPLVAVFIFCSYTGFLIVSMVVSFIGWKRYRNFYNSVFNK